MGTAAGSHSGRMVSHNMVTTQFELDGYRVARTLGVVRGIVVRSRSIFGTIGAGLQTLVGGNITLLTNLCDVGNSAPDRLGIGIETGYFVGSTNTAVPYASTSVTPCMISVAS